MSANVRRRVLRPAVPVPAATLRNHDRQRKQQARLDRERAIFERWLAKLKRAFHAIEKSQGRIARLEREIARHDQNGAA